MNIKTSNKIFRNITARRYFAAYNYTNPSNPKVFMNISKDGQDIGKMIFEVSLSL